MSRPLQREPDLTSATEPGVASVAPLRAASPVARSDRVSRHGATIATGGIDSGGEGRPGAAERGSILAAFRPSASASLTKASASPNPETGVLTVFPDVG